MILPIKNADRNFNATIHPHMTWQEWKEDEEKMCVGKITTCGQLCIVISYSTIM